MEGIGANAVAHLAKQTPGLLRRPSYLLGFILAAFILAISLTGWNYYQRQRQAFQKATERELWAVAGLKVSQIERWREERLEDANLLLDTSMVRSAVDQFLTNPNNSAARLQLQDWMDNYRKHDYFDRLVLLDATLTPRLASPAKENWVGPLAAQFATLALHTNRVLISDLHISQVSGRVNMDYLIPVCSPNAGAARPLLNRGVFLLEVDPQRFLFPSLRSWPTSSRTAETLLVRREGNDVVFLNELRHRTNTALRLRFPLKDHPRLPATHAALGREGLVPGLDYRQEPVLAAVRPIPNSPWAVVAKCDLAEMNAPLRRLAWGIGSLTAILILAATLAVALVWRNREYQFSLQELEERELREEAIRQNAERLKTLTAAAFEGICVSEQGRILDVNEPLLALIGYGRNDVIDQPILAFVAPESRPEAEATIQNNSEARYELQLVRKNGTRFEAEVQARLVTWGNRRLRLTAVRDITERKRAQAALQQRLVALTQPLDSAADITFEHLFDPEEIQKVQDAFAEAAGVASIITRPDGVPLTRPSRFCRLCNDIIRQTEKGRANCFCSDALIGRYNPKGPTVQPCLSGGLWDAGASIEVGGKHIANWLIGQVRNETQSEDKLLRYALEIGADPEAFRLALREVPVMPQDRFERVAQAMFVLANELSLRAYQNCQQARFIADRKRSEAERDRLVRELFRKNKELESVIYVSSHDLRSPLVNIQGFSHRLQNACEELQRLASAPDTPAPFAAAFQPLLQDRINPSLKFIQTSVSKMDTLLSGLLRLSRLGRGALHPETLDMNRLLRSVLETLAFQVQQAGATVHLADLPPCRGDATQLSQVFSNLIDNALKYRSPDRPLQLHIHGELQAERVLYCLHDNGLGVAPENQERIWEVFQRLDTSETVKGEGLGLAIVRRILDRHDGRAWIESQPGLGSRFFVELPANSNTNPNPSPLPVVSTPT